MSHFSTLSRPFAALAASALLIIGVTASAAPGNWLTTYTASSRGGHIVGNPKAKTKIVEYASYTCSHCAEFETVDAPAFKTQYIADGSVSFEIRNYVRDPLDMTMALLARCGGTARFFANHRYLMATQDTWLARRTKISQASWFLLKPDSPSKAAEKKAMTAFMQRAFVEMNLASIVAPRGITPAAARACIADPVALDRVLAMTDEAANTYGFSGTPSFMINGLAEHNVHDMVTLKNRLKAVTQ